MRAQKFAMQEQLNAAEARPDVAKRIEHVRVNRKLATEMLGISLRTLQNRIAALRAEEKTAPPRS